MLVLLLTVVFAVLAVYCFGGGFACVLFWMTACDGWLLQFGGVLVNSVVVYAWMRFALGLA